MTLALDADGKTLLSRQVANDVPEPLKLVGDVLGLADGRQVTWATGPSATTAIAGAFRRVPDDVGVW